MTVGLCSTAAGATLTLDPGLPFLSSRDWLQALNSTFLHDFWAQRTLKIFSFYWDYTHLLKNAGTIAPPPSATSLTRDSFVLTDVSSLDQEILSLGRSLDTAPWGAASLPHTARLPSQVAGQARPLQLS